MWTPFIYDDSCRYCSIVDPIFQSGGVVLEPFEPWIAPAPNITSFAHICKVYLLSPTIKVSERGMQPRTGIILAERFYDSAPVN